MSLPLPGGRPSWPQMVSVRDGWELPPKTTIFRTILSRMSRETVSVLLQIDRNRVQLLVNFGMAVESLEYRQKRQLTLGNSGVDDRLAM